jgi:NAD-dependent deacetylase
VDDLHERAGSVDVLHLHGELSRPYCEACRRSYVHPAGITDPSPAGARIEPPHCGECGAPIRPGVVWFGEGLPEREWRAACGAARQCELFFCVGTSSVVQPAASLTDLAIRVGAMTVQISPNATGYDNAVTVAIHGLAGIVLPKIVEETWKAN